LCHATGTASVMRVTTLQQIIPRRRKDHRGTRTFGYWNIAMMVTRLACPPRRSAAGWAVRTRDLAPAADVVGAFVSKLNCVYLREDGSGSSSFVTTVLLRRAGRISNRSTAFAKASQAFGASTVPSRCNSVPLISTRQRGISHHPKALRGHDRSGIFAGFRLFLHPQPAPPFQREELRGSGLVTSQM
jgi:hypothetical protein